VFPMCRGDSNFHDALGSRSLFVIPPNSSSPLSTPNFVPIRRVEQAPLVC
jgi:hypothetical protein